MTRARPALRRALVGALVAWLVATNSGALAHAEDKQVFTLDDSAITESSGLARDVPGQRYWTVNDSGDSGRAFAISKTGKVEGWVGFRAKPVDVEAVAYYGSRLYVADIGDNASKRATVVVYVLYNPQPNKKMAEYQAYDFTYPDGPRDAETLLISKTGRLYIVSKEADGGIYRAPEFPSRLRSNRLERIGDAPSYVTDGQYLPDGNRIALRTYVSVQMLDAKTRKVVAQAATPAQPQGESLTVDLAGTSLLVGSEGKNSAVYSMPIPQSGGTAPSAGPTPGTPAASPSTAAASSTPTDDGDDSGGGMGAALPLLVAGAVAVVAGLVVFAVRRRPI